PRRRRDPARRADRRGLRRVRRAGRTAPVPRGRRRGAGARRAPPGCRHTLRSGGRRRARRRPRGRRLHAGRIARGRQVASPPMTFTRLRRLRSDTSTWRCEMPQTVVLVGTRKGLFVLASDADRRDWEVRGPFCESWPVYHAVYDSDTGTIYAAAGSEWHGSAVWRSSDLGESWEHSSEGLNYENGDLKL